MLEKMAEMVREEAAKATDADRQFMPCLACDMQPANTECFDNIKRRLRCPSPADPAGSLMLARWAVLLVARALEKWVSEIDRTNGVDLGDVEALGSEFMDLYYEVKKAEAKEAAHEA